MTELRILRPMLDAADLEATIAFYTGVLGFTVTNRMEMTWVSLQKDDVSLMFNQLHTHEHEEEDHGHDHPSEPVMTGSLYFNVDDVDALAGELEGKVALAFGPATQPHGMREIGFPDPNGYFLIFGTPVDGA